MCSGRSRIGHEREVFAGNARGNPGCNHHWIHDTEDDAPRVFWLHANAATGKSSIVHTIAHHFRELGRLGSCYCFDRTRAASHTTRVPYRSIDTVSSGSPPVLGYMANSAAKGIWVRA